MTRPAKIGAGPFPILTGTGGMGGVSVPPGPPTPMALDDLTDVDTTGVVDGDVLTFEYGEWVALPGTSAGRWELAVIPGSPPDTLYADGDWLYIFVP